MMPAIRPEHCEVSSLRRKLLTVLGVGVMAGLSCKTPAFEAQSGPLTPLVEGAKKERTVSLKLHPGLAGKGIERLKRGVAERYGVDLQIAFIPSTSYPQALAMALFERQAGVPPSYDLLPFADVDLAQAVSAGIAEKVDWEPFLAPGTPAEVIQFDGHAISTHTTHTGLVYNPAVVSAQEAPRTLLDLANPKWRGKIILFPYASVYISYAVVMGADQTLAVLREIMNNEPTVEIFARSLTRYMAGEYPLMLTGSGFFAEIQKNGVPAQWRSLDISRWTTHSVIVLKGARHPNAAKLVALYLASPEGHRLMLEEASSGSIFYPGNMEQEIAQEDRRRGLKVYNPVEWPGSLDFLLSPQARQLEEQIGQILRGR